MRAEMRSNLYDGTTTTVISAVLASYKCKAAAVIVLATNSNNFSDTNKWLARFKFAGAASPSSTPMIGWPTD